MAADLETQLRRALRDSRYDEAVDVDGLLHGIAGPAASRTDERPTTVARRLLPAAAGAALVAATVAIVVSVGPTGSRPGQLRGAAAASDTVTVSSPSRPHAPTDSIAFPWTPRWLPYGLDLRTDLVEASASHLSISRRMGMDASMVSIQVADPSTLQTRYPDDHFSTKPVTVLGRPAVLGVATTDPASDRYLLFQPTQGQWLLVVARSPAATPADESTVVRIADGLVHADLTATPLAPVTSTVRR